jgi:hypothetical protein
MAGRILRHVEPAKDRPCLPTGCFDAETAEHFMDISWGQGWASVSAVGGRFVKERLQRNAIDDPLQLPAGGHHQEPHGALHQEDHSASGRRGHPHGEVTYRQIFTTADRPVDPQPSYNGYSTWTLMVTAGRAHQRLLTHRLTAPEPDHHRGHDYGTIPAEGLQGTRNQRDRR